MKSLLQLVKSAKKATDDTKINQGGCVAIKLYLQRQAKGLSVAVAYRPSSGAVLGRLRREHSGSRSEPGLQAQGRRFFSAG